MRALSAIPSMTRVEHDTVYMRGGWDTSTPTLELYAGVLRDVQNFEVSATVAGGYARVDGYERFNGKVSPSSATYTLIQLSSFVNIPTLGQTLTGQTSAATGVIIVITATYLIVTKVSTSFTDTEVVKVGATTIGTAVPVTTILSALLTAQYLQVAADNYRADIAAVPGSGPVRGVVSIVGSDVVYAFRDNAGATALDIYKSSASGWVNVPLFLEVRFTAGGAGTPADGNTLTQGGVTATIKRVVLQSGAWLGSSAAGRFIITNLAGGNFGAGAATAGAVGVTLSAIQTAIVMLPGGTFEFAVDNFAGQATSMRAYGCDGINRGFEFDGETLVPITTGATVDTPTHVSVHRLHLFFGFGSSAIHSGPGTPYKWSAPDGALEIALGDVVTNFLRQPGSATSGALGITTITNTLILYGGSASTWNLTNLHQGIGGIPFTGQLMNQSYWMNGQGVIDMHATFNFGNFRQATITTNIDDFITAQRANVVTAVLNRTKNQYRVLFVDGTVLMITIVNGKVAGMTKGLYVNPMDCAWSSEASNYEERVFCGGATSGHVYQMDKGSSFDGADIDAYLIFNWNTMRRPRIRKRFRRTSIEMQGSFYAAFSFGYSLGYGLPYSVQPPTASYESGFSGTPLWDTFVWDAAVWDGVTLSPTDVRTTGRAENIQVTIRSGTNYMYSYVINSLIFHYSVGRGLR